jgi:hypothetical protein
MDRMLTQVHDALVEQRQALAVQEPPQILTHEAAFVRCKNPGGSGVGTHDPSMCIDDQNPIHRRIQETRELRLAAAHLLFRPQAADLGGRPLGEHLEDGQDPRILRQGLAVEDGEMTEDRAVGILQRNAEVADASKLARSGSPGNNSTTRSGMRIKRHVSMTGLHGVPSTSYS